jgi:hypothetical protein
MVGSSPPPWAAGRLLRRADLEPGAVCGQLGARANYGAIGDDFVNREAGHAAQSVLVEATALEPSVVPWEAASPRPSHAHSPDRTTSKSSI